MLLSTIVDSIVWDDASGNLRIYMGAKMDDLVSLSDGSHFCSDGRSYIYDDKIIVLSKRPASVKSVHEINLVTEGEKTPLKTRKVPQFQYYFDILWKELDSYEIKQ